MKVLRNYQKKKAIIPSPSGNSLLSISEHRTRHPDRHGFLCTRVQAPDVDDYKKLTKVMQYLCGMRHLTLTIEPDGDNNLNWWVDSSYTVHPYMRSHSGIIMTLGKGATYTASTKQKINTKSSTEAELVAIDNSMAQALFFGISGFTCTDHNNLPGQ